MAVTIRAKMDPKALIPAVRRHVAAIDAVVPIRVPGRFEDKLGATRARRWLKSLLRAVSESDSATLAATAAGVLGLELIAASVPVRRVTRVIRSGT